MIKRTFFIFSLISFLMATGFVMSQNHNHNTLLKKYKNLTNNKTEVPIKEQINLYNKLGKYYRFVNNDSVLYFAEKALQLNSEFSYPEEYVKSLLLQGDFQTDNGALTEAIKKYNKADSIITIINKPKLQVEHLKSLAIVHYFGGQQKEMLYNTYKAIDICQENSYMTEEGILRHNLGFIYSNNKMYDEAEKELISALNIWHVLNDKEHLSSTLSNLALNSVRSNSFNHFEESAHECLSLLEAQNNPLWTSRIYRVMAEYSYVKNDYDSAVNWINKSDSMLTELNNPRDVLESLTINSNIYTKKNNLVKAEVYSLKALEQGKKYKDTVKILNALKNLKTIFQQKSIEEALLYQEQYDEIRKIFKNSEASKNLKFLKAKLEFEKEQLHLSHINERQLNLRTQWILVSFIVLLGFVTIALLIRRNNLNQEKTKEELTKLNEAKDYVFSIIGHDLKSPISTLQELLVLYDKKFVTGQDVVKFVPNLKENADHGSFTLNNLLYWAKSQMNGLVANPQKIEIQKKFKQTCNLYAVKTKKKNLIINWSITPELYVWADTDHLDIILRNIVSNAIKFSYPNGKIHFKGYESGSKVVIEVIDQGVGMNEQRLNEILNSHPIKANSGTEKEKGTGIGIQIIKDLLNLNKGSFTISSCAFSGTSVIVTLPKA